MVYNRYRQNNLCVEEKKKKQRKELHFCTELMPVFFHKKYAPYLYTFKFKDVFEIQLQ